MLSATHTSSSFGVGNSRDLGTLAELVMGSLFECVWALGGNNQISGRRVPVWGNSRLFGHRYQRVGQDGRNIEGR